MLTSYSLSKKSPFSPRRRRRRTAISIIFCYTSLLPTLLIIVVAAAASSAVITAATAASVGSETIGKKMSSLPSAAIMGRRGRKSLTGCSTAISATSSSLSRRNYLNNITPPSIRSSSRAVNIARFAHIQRQFGGVAFINSSPSSLLSSLHPSRSNQNYYYSVDKLNFFSTRSDKRQPPPRHHHGGEVVPLFATVPKPNEKLKQSPAATTVTTTIKKTTPPKPYDYAASTFHHTSPTESSSSNNNKTLQIKSKPKSDGKGNWNPKSPLQWCQSFGSRSSSQQEHLNSLIQLHPTDERYISPEVYNSQSYPNVTVVRTKEQARIVLEALQASKEHEPYRIHACDTEVMEIDLSNVGPVGNGYVTCLSVYSGPDFDYGLNDLGPGTMLWIDNLDDACGILHEFQDWLEDESVLKVWHNYGFDRHVLWNEGINVLGFGGDTS